MFMYTINIVVFESCLTKLSIATIIHEIFAQTWEKKLI